MMNIGKLFVISAPSGCGKTTLCKRLLEEFKDNLTYSVSYTTRKPRLNEINGRDYYFVARETFNEMIDSGEFLEWASIYGEYYGTAKKQIEENLFSKKDVVMDIDPQGALQIRSKMKEAILIIIVPPSLAVLEERLKTRKTESEDKLRIRLSNAKKEILNYKYYDYIVVNDDFNVAYRELVSIYIAEHCKIVDLNNINEIINLED
jgi:guanylate kinase